MTIYKDTVGLPISIETGQTVTGAINIEIHVKKPKGNSIVWTGATVSGTTKFLYTTKLGDLDEDGIYIVYPKFTLSGFSGFGDPARFIVKNILTPDRVYKL